MPKTLAAFLLIASLAPLFNYCEEVCCEREDICDMNCIKGCVEAGVM